MDFMRVIDQTVREIKREVNLKVLKVPEIEQKVLDATDNEPWGPHGTALAEIAQATKKYTECQMVMNVLWTRLGETGKDWRYVYKALAVIEYLIGNGSERAVDDIINHTFQISSLIGFEYVEPNGKDMGINVRKKAEKVAALLNDNEKIQEVRNKAAATREKYIGLSSTGMSYKSSAASYGGGGSFQSSNRYGGFGSRYDPDIPKDSYRDNDEDQFEKYVPMSRQFASSERKTTRHGSKDQDVTSSGPSKSASQSNSDQYNVISQGANTSSNSLVDDDDDDFDPWGTNTSNAKPATRGSQKVDLFGESLMGDFLDASSSIPPQSSAMANKSVDVDLFSDANFVSAAPKLETGCNSEPQANIDLFSAEPASSDTVSSTMDFFASSDPVAFPATKSGSTEPSNLTTVDPFAALPKSVSTSPSNLTTVDPFATMRKSESTGPSDLTMVDPFATGPKSSNAVASDLTTVGPFATGPTNGFNGSDLFGGFTSHTDQSSSAPKQDPLDISTVNDVSGKSMSESKASSKKDGFQVKSGIWADSLSRGLIDLNISGPKKVNLADVGIIGDLTIGSEEKQKSPTTSYYMGSAMGSGPGIGRTGPNPTGTIEDDFFSSFSSSGSSQQYQYNGFQK